MGELHQLMYIKNLSDIIMNDDNLGLNSKCF